VHVGLSSQQLPIERIFAPASNQPVDPNPPPKMCTSGVAKAVSIKTEIGTPNATRKTLDKLEPSVIEHTRPQPPPAPRLRPAASPRVVPLPLVLPPAVTSPCRTNSFSGCTTTPGGDDFRTSSSSINSGEEDDEYIGFGMFNNLGDGIFDGLDDLNVGEWGSSGSDGEEFEVRRSTSERSLYVSETFANSESVDSALFGYPVVSNLVTDLSPQLMLDMSDELLFEPCHPPRRAPQPFVDEEFGTSAVSASRSEN